MDANTKTTLQEAVERRDLLRVNVETKLLESFWDGFGGTDLMYDIMQQRFGDQGGTWVPISVISDRKDGANWPLFRNETDLARYRQASRILCEKNAYAKSLLNNLGNYIIGKGFTYRAKPKVKHSGESESGDGKTVAQAVQRIIDAFLAANRWTATVNPDKDQSLVAGSRERETLRRVYRDGDCLLRLFFLEDGRTAVRFVEPEQVTQPPHHEPGDGWSFGMRHSVEPFEDEESIEAYWVRYKDQTGKEEQGEEVPASEIVHIKMPDQDAAVKRGLPAFTLDTMDAFERAAKLMRNVSISSAVRAATAEIWQHENATAAQVSSLAQNLGERQVANPTTGRLENIERTQPGTKRRIPAGQKPVWPQAVGATEHLEIVQGDLRQAVTPFSAPEFFTGDASNANYASTKEAGTPFVLSSEVVQEHFKLAFTVVMIKAIYWAIKCGRLPANALEVCELQVETPVVAVRDPLQKAQEDQILVGTKIKSVQTAQMERGLDPEREAANAEEFDQRFGGQGQGLQIPGMGGDRGDQGGGGPGDPGGLPGGDRGDGGLGQMLGLESLEDYIDIPANLLEGFTGVDSNGHHWVNGHQVAVSKEASTGDRPSPAEPVKKSRLAAAMDKLTGALRSGLDFTRQRAKDLPQDDRTGKPAVATAAIQKGWEGFQEWLKSGQPLEVDLEPLPDLEEIGRRTGRYSQEGANRSINEFTSTVAKTFGIDPKQAFNIDLSNTPAIRQYAYSNPGGFDARMNRAEDCLNMAIHLSGDQEQVPLLKRSLGQIHRLRDAVTAFRAKYQIESPPSEYVPGVPKGVPVQPRDHAKTADRAARADVADKVASGSAAAGGDKPGHYRQRGAAQINTQAAIDYLAKGGDPKSAVDHVMKHGGLTRATAQRYVRAAVKQAAAYADHRVLQLKDQVKNAG